MNDMSERTSQEAVDLYDAFRLALIELERLAYLFGPDSDERFDEQIKRCRQLRDELVELENRK